jgi:hypothetical protein
MSMLVQLNVARDSPARAYTLGVPFEGTLEDDPTFFLFSTSGVTEEHSLFGMDLQTTNWIGYVGIGPKGDDGRDIAVAFRGTQVRARQHGTKLRKCAELLDTGTCRRKHPLLCNALATCAEGCSRCGGPCRRKSDAIQGCGRLPGRQERPRPAVKAVLCQAWSEWLSDARGLFEMNRWSDDAALLVGGGGRNFPVEQILARELGDDTPVTKTEPPAVDRPVLNLGDVRIGEGFEQMYRGFEKTPGNTLSLQARCITLTW